MPKSLGIVMHTLLHFVVFLMSDLLPEVWWVIPLSIPALSVMYEGYKMHLLTTCMFSSYETVVFVKGIG
jgi:hypothetical protein